VQLIKTTTLNQRYFTKGSGPSTSEWADMIDEGTINGKVMRTKKLLVWIDLDDFLSKDTFLTPAANDETPTINATVANLLNRPA